MMSLWPKQEHLCHSGASLVLLTITSDKHKQLCLNIVYKHRWAFLHLGSLCLGLLLGSRRPFGLRSGCEQREGESGISAGQVGAFWRSSNSWILFWLPVSHVYLGLLLSLCCGLIVGADLRLGWTFSREKVILQKTQRCCFSRCCVRVIRRLFWICPFCCHQRRWCSVFCHTWEWKILLFQLFGLLSTWKQVSEDWDFSEDTAPFFWQLFGWLMTGKVFKATSDSWVPCCYHRNIKSLHSIASSLKTLSVQDWPHPPIIQIIRSIPHREVALSPRMKLIGSPAQGKPTVN